MIPTTPDVIAAVPGYPRPAAPFRRAAENEGSAMPLFPSPVESRLGLLQRLSAAVLVPLIAVHVVVIVYAARQGFSAAALLERTRGSLAWAGFYGLFVVAAALHGAIGLRTVVLDSLDRPALADAIAVAMLVVGLATGFRAVAAVTL
jgi:fumarate reductase subunit C